MWLLLRETVRQFEQRGQTVVDVSEWITRCGQSMSLQRSIAARGVKDLDVLSSQLDFPDGRIPRAVGTP